MSFSDSAAQTLTLSTSQQVRVRVGRAVAVFPLVWIALALVFSPDVLFGGRPAFHHVLSWTLLATVAAGIGLSLRPRGPAAVRWEDGGIRVLDQEGQAPFVPFSRVREVRTTQGVLGWGACLVLEEGRTVDVLMRGAPKSELVAWVAAAERQRLATRSLDPGEAASMMRRESPAAQESHAPV